MTYEAVDVGPMLKTAMPSLYEVLKTAQHSLYDVLYFAVLLDHCLMSYSTS
jgi:hypothetical protein